MRECGYDVNHSLDKSLGLCGLLHELCLQMYHGLTVNIYSLRYTVLDRQIGGVKEKRSSCNQPSFPFLLGIQLDYVS